MGYWCHRCCHCCDGCELSVGKVRALICGQMNELCGGWVLAVCLCTLERPSCDRFLCAWHIQWCRSHQEKTARQTWWQPSTPWLVGQYFLLFFPLCLFTWPTFQVKSTDQSATLHQGPTSSTYRSLNTVSVLHAHRKNKLSDPFWTQSYSGFPSLLGFM